MDVHEILDKIRSGYIQGFIHQAKELQSKHDVALEPPMRTQDGDYTTAGFLELPLRQDVALFKDQHIETRAILMTATPNQFDPLQLTTDDDNHLAINPFQWNHCICQFSDGPEEPDWNYLRQWFLKWFDESIADEHGLSGCVHSMTDLIQMNNKWQCTIDFGSAPIDAVEDLIGTIRSLGYQSIHLGYKN